MTAEEIAKRPTPLTWNELADHYDAAHTGRKARTLPMENVFEWGEKQTDRFVLHDDCLYPIADCERAK